METTKLEDFGGIDFSCILPSNVNFLANNQNWTRKIDAKIVMW